VRIDLPYGSEPYPLDLGDRDVTVVRAPVLPPAPQTRELLSRALARPIGRALPALPAGSRVTLIVSDPTRAEPRGLFVDLLRERYPDVRWTIAVATGTHGPCNLEHIGITKNMSWVFVNHDGHRGDGLVELGRTKRGTPVRIHRCVVDADLVIATGCIRPHYFAGFGAGVKAIFPGLGEAAAIRMNHRLKQEPGARAGVVVGNPCREDLEEAFSLVPAPTFLLNGVCGPDGGIHAAVAGDPIAAFRAGAELARPWFSVRAPRGALVLASDRAPVTNSLYQAAKIAAAMAPLVAEGGTLAVVADCRDGIGPIETVNEAIFRIGVLPRLPPGARLVLVSGLPREEVARTLLEYAPSVEALLADAAGKILVVPQASQLICEATEAT
jgi:nickel-dependent lactate racemase